MLNFCVSVLLLIASLNEVQSREVSQVVEVREVSELSAQSSSFLSEQLPPHSTERFMAPQNKSVLQHYSPISNPLPPHQIPILISSDDAMPSHRRNLCGTHSCTSNTSNTYPLRRDWVRCQTGFHRQTANPFYIECIFPSWEAHSDEKEEGGKRGRKERRRRRSEEREEENEKEREEEREEREEGVLFPDGAWLEMRMVEMEDDLNNRRSLSQVVTDPIFFDRSFLLIRQQEAPLLKVED
eukprot:GHVN01048683.1.p1 GENE.GHVN01048683.1~~GHVN01048683.1.p1  ORF type:complete len:240 (-),score=73.96 GHVN01048683.1:86-805(-)